MNEQERQLICSIQGSVEAWASGAVTVGELGELILVYIKQANYVKLANDQRLPQLKRLGTSQIQSCTSSQERHLIITASNAGQKLAQQDMLKQGWRKVEL